MFEIGKVIRVMVRLHRINNNLMFISVLLSVSYRYSFTIRFHIDIVFVLMFLVAQIIHSQQMEITRRLDFIWKLQATGDDALHFPFTPYCRQ